VEHLKNYREMAEPFEGIDDGLGRKFFPSLPSFNLAGSSQDSKWLKLQLECHRSPLVSPGSYLSLRTYE
jgi:hypothetical protein